MPGGGEMTNEVPSTSTVTYGTDDDNSENVTDTSFPDTGVGYPGMVSQGKGLVQCVTVSRAYAVLSLSITVYTGLSELISTEGPPQEKCTNSTKKKAVAELLAVGF